VIASYGEAAIDLFASPVGRRMTDAHAFEPHLGGSTCNVAVVAARLGARVRFIGSVGADAFGTRVREGLARECVDVSSLWEVRGARTPVTFVTVAEDGERSFVSYRPGGDPDSEPPAGWPLRGLDGVQWLHASSSGLRGAWRAEITRRLIEEAHRRGVRVSVDFNVRPGLSSDLDALRSSLRALCAGAALVKASEEDLRWIGLKPTLDALAHMAPGAVTVLTRAERGAVARVGALQIEATAPEVAVVDATGAGDAFMGALLTRVDDGGFAARDARTWYDDLRFACAVGAAAVTRLGATAGVAGLRADEGS
jgi:fructokinase